MAAGSCVEGASVNFSPRYIELCKILYHNRPRKPEEWQVGDWSMDTNQSSLITALWIEEGITAAVRVQNPSMWWRFDASDGDLLFWLPHRESSWMVQPEWPAPPRYWVLEREGDDWAILDLISQGKTTFNSQVIASSENPLEACAEAWLIALKEAQAVDAK